MPDASGLTFAKAFAKTAGVLRQAGIGSPELDARLLLCHAAGLHTKPLSRERTAISGRQPPRGSKR